MRTIDKIEKPTRLSSAPTIPKLRRLVEAPAAQVRSLRAAESSVPFETGEVAGEVIFPEAVETMLQTKRIEIDGASSFTPVQARDYHSFARPK